jgi:hypothetical protein
MYGAVRSSRLKIANVTEGFPDGTSPHRS